MNVFTWGKLSLAIDGAAKATLTDWQRKVAYKTEAKENGTGWPKTQLKGPELGQVSFSVVLSRSMGVDVRATLDAWENACCAGTAAQMKLGNQTVGAHKWLIKDVTESDMFFDMNMRMIQATMKLTFSEYANAAASTAKSTSKNTTKKKTAAKKVSPSKKDAPAPAKGSGVDITQKYIDIKRTEKAKRQGLSIK